MYTWYDIFVVTMSRHRTHIYVLFFLVQVVFVVFTTVFVLVRVLSVWCY